MHQLSRTLIVFVLLASVVSVLCVVALLVRISKAALEDWQVSFWFCFWDTISACDGRGIELGWTKARCAIKSFPNPHTIDSSLAPGPFGL